MAEKGTVGAQILSEVQALRRELADARADFRRALAALAMRGGKSDRDEEEDSDDDF